MSYQVIARKWRPQKFEEVTGQQPITRTLQNSIKMGRLHHAYIFSGPRGCGKTTTARILAKALNCFTGVTPEPCGNCASCQEIAAGSSIDVLEIDAASNTGVDNVRDVIINTIAINPARDRYKIFIIDEVHMLSMSAFNALLKTLEEPPPHAIFILATTELHKLPQTILSRCQHFEFRTISAESIAERLRLIADAEQLQISDAAVLEIALAGQGSMRDAQSAFDQVISFAGATIAESDVREALGVINQQTLNDFTFAIAERDERRLIMLTAEMASTGYDLRQFCRDLMNHFRNLLVLRTVGYEREVLPIAEGELPRYRAQAERFSSEDLVRFFHQLTTLEQEIKLTTQPRLQLEIGLIKLAQLSRLQSLDELLQRLTALEARITAGGFTPPTPGTNPPAKRASTVAEPPPGTPEKSLDLRAGEPKPVTETRAVTENRPVSEPRPIKREPEPRTVAAKRPAAPSTPVKRTANPVEAMPPEPPPEPPPWDIDEPINSFEPPPAFNRPNSPVNSTKPSVSTTDSPAESAAADSSNASPIERLKNELEARRRMMLLTALEAAKIEIVGDSLKIIFDGKSTELYKKVAAKDSRQFIAEAARTALGGEFKVDVKFNDDGGLGSDEDSDILNRQKLRKQAESDPTVQGFLKTFKGELIDVQQDE